MALKKTSIAELEELLRALGLKENDVAMVHSAVFTLGLVEDGLDGIYAAFRNVAGEGGTIIVPTFTYSFRRKEIFDINESPSSKFIGIFAEYIRKRSDAVRSACPLFSMAAIGPRAEELMSRESNACFGSDSIYEKLFENNMLLVALGITYSTGISAFMHLEKLAEVDYRVDLPCYGLSRGIDGLEYEDWAMHYARDENNYPDRDTNRDNFGLELEEQGISTAVNFGSGRHVALRAKSFLDYTVDKLIKDPHLMLGS